MNRFFDKLEDSTRQHLSRYPIVYSLIGGVGVVLFWRSIWETADLLSKIHPLLTWFFYPPFQIAISTLGLLLVGLFVSIFIGDKIIISGIRREKKIEERTEELVKEEAITLKHVRDEIRSLHSEIVTLNERTKDL
jgi:hypothetical protein